jgi:hypothetical protein
MAGLMAGALVLLIAAIMAVGGIIVARWILHALRRRYERRTWDDLVARYRELDEKLDEIWRR